VSSIGHGYGMSMSAPEKQLHEMSLEELVEVFERDSEGETGWADDDVETAATILSCRGDTGIRYLLDYLSSADTSHAQAVLWAFRDHELESVEVREALVNAVNDFRPPVLFEAVFGLAMRGVRDVLPNIEPLVQHESAPVRSAAIKYLAMVYPEIAINYVEGLHADPSWNVREGVLTELERTEDEELAKLAVPYALKSLDDPHPYVREDAAELLEYIYWEAKSPKELIEGRSDSNPRIRASALRAAAHNTLETAHDVIASGLADPDRVVRLNALDEIFEIYRENQRHPPPSMPAVPQWIAEDDPVIREAAEAATAAKNGETGFYVHRY
jgi:HEAT repeat protein